jgi:hypothetical protein
MDSRAEELLRRFAEIECGEEVVTAFRAGGATETVRRPHAEVAEFLPEQGIVEVRHGPGVARLHFEESELLALLRTAGRDGSEAWGEGVSDLEAAARFLSVWLDESLTTRQPHPSGWWSYGGGAFDPLPPWEAHARRRDAEGPRSA